MVIFELHYSISIYPVKLFISIIQYRASIKIANLLETNSNLLAETIALKKEIQFKDVIIKAKEDNIKDLQNQTGFLIFEFQRINKINEQLLLTENESIKKWWEFWKK